MSVVEMISELGLGLTVHSSVMMDVHNLAIIKALRDLGVTRVVISREMSLQQINKVSVQTDMEYETGKSNQETYLAVKVNCYEAAKMAIEEGGLAFQHPLVISEQDIYDLLGKLAQALKVINRRNK